MMRPTHSCAPAPATPCNGEAFNVGGNEPISHRELTTLLIAAAGSGRVEYVEWPSEKKAIDIGSFYADSSKFHAADRLDAVRPASRRARVDAGVLPGALRTVRGCRRAEGGGVSRFRIPFGSPAPREDAGAIRAAIDRVVGSGWFVLGPEVAAFETEFAECLRRRSRRRRRNRHRCDRPHPARARHRTGRRSHHDAALGRLHRAGGDDGGRAAGLRRHRLRTADARSGGGGVARSRRAPRAILPVHLYGQPADMAGAADASRRGTAWPSSRMLPGASRHGAGRPVGTIGVAGAFSFYPTKNLGALGDGGAIVTNDAALAARLKRLRNGGQTDRYHHVEFGINSRLDEMQAAILRARLPFLRGLDRAATALAAALPLRTRRCAGQVPREFDAGHVYHLFVVRTAQRDALQQHLAGDGIETLVHYPVPIPRQPALASQRPADCPAANRALRRSAVAAASPRARRMQTSRPWPRAVRAFSRG